ncbi:MAG: efflux RND transporter periplasmic adaptor subunit, partial [Candidatus Rokubacteria bacterium]|nr:efflux RND transporter periplasmic adaptor subunit [Candidatus Rokubacteria bacterium]
ARYDEIVAAGAGAGAPPGAGENRRPTQGRVFVLDGDGKPKAVPVVLGISDGTTTEIVQGDLREGQDVVVGLAGGAAGRQPQAPGPRMRL